MLSCPNTNSPKWIALEQEVGYFEALRDYLETGRIRESQDVLDKLERRNRPGIATREQYLSLEELHASSSVDEIGIKIHQLKNAKAVELANKMSRTLGGVEYESITEDQALSITQGSSNPWSGEPSFFFGGRVYFVQDKMTTDNVFHEFSHPFVRALRLENNALFTNIYNNLILTEAGKDIQKEVQKLYSDIDQDDQMEEVFVRALSTIGIAKLQDQSLSPGLSKFLRDFMYAVKQLLRKFFGKELKLSDLDVNTDLNSLADILSSGGVIKIDTEIVSDEDVVAYNREIREEVTRDLTKVRNKEIQDTINTFYDIVSTQLDMLMKNDNYEELATLLKKGGELGAIKANLAQWQSTIRNSAENLELDINESKTRVTALTNSLFRLEDTLEKIYIHTRDISQYPDSQDNMHKAYYYDKLIKYWGKFIDEIEDAITDPDNDVPTRSPVTSLIGDMKAYITKTKRLINEMYATGARDALYDQIKPLSDAISSKYEGMIKEAEDKKNPKVINDLYREYHGMNKDEYDSYSELLEKEKEEGLSLEEKEKLKTLNQKSQKGLSISREKIEQLLKGEIGDANWFNSYLEGYLYNTDPVIGGLALYVKNALNDVMTKNQQMFNEFALDVREDLKKAGYDPNKIGDLGEKVAFKDKIGKINQDTGQLEEKEVWTFLNEFKDYRYKISEFEFKIGKAHDNWLVSQSDSDRDIWLTLKAEYDRFKRDYMYQDYVDVFYDRYQLLEEDEIGREAKFQRDSLFEKMRQIQEPNKTQSDQLLTGEMMDQLWREYKQLHSRYDLNGALKTGRDADVAARLREFREKSREFYEFRIRKNAFENAYSDYQEEVLSQGIERNSPEFKERMQVWQRRNTRVVIKPEFYERRNRIISEIKKIMSKLPDAERKEIDQSAIWEKILDLTSGFRDEDGQPVASEMSEGAIAEVKELQLELEEVKKRGVLKSGLTLDESDDLSNMFLAKRLGIDYDAEYMHMLLDKKRTDGINRFDSSALEGLYAELRELSTREVTDYYLNIINNWLSKVNTDDLYASHKTRTIDNENYKAIINGDIMGRMMRQDPEFERWFKDNHILKVKRLSGSNEEIEIYEPLYVWAVVRPIDPNMMETYDVTDSTGKVLETVSGLPSMSYYSRIVKTKYRTRNVPGVTKDNQGRYLPKTIADGAKDDRFINKEYEALKKSDPNTFALLEKLKKNHLKYQEGLPYSSKMYMDIPRYRKSNLEVLQTTGFLKSNTRPSAISLFSKRIKDFMTGEDGNPDLNYDTRLNLVRADMFDDEMTNIPISGLHNIPVEDVSTDVILGMMRYMASGNRQKQLIKISPVVRAIQATVNDPKNSIDDIKRVNKKEMQNRGIMRFLPKRENVRKAAINNFIEREFEGKIQKGLGSDAAWLQNISNVLFSRASFSFFALNIPSALKNSMGMKLQSMIEASGGQYVDHISLQKGNIWSYKTMSEISFGGQIYSDGPKSHNMQMVEIFDMNQDKFNTNFGESISRSFVKDAASMSWLYTPRKWVELQAGLQLSSGMLYKKKIKQKVDGREIEIPYIDAFETVNGQIKLKEGIDVRYAPNPTTYVVKPGDTLESIALKHNIPVSEIEAALRGVTIDSILEAVDEIEKERKAELSDIDLDSATDDMEEIKLLDRINAINKKFNRQLDEKRLKIDNSEFKFMRNRMHQVTNNMGGAYAKFDQPEAQRYLAFRFISYMRRYFTTMAVSRWGFSGSIMDPRPRLNPGLGDTQMGFYIRFAKLIKKILFSGGKHIMYMTPEEKTAFFKFTAEVVSLMSINFLLGLLFSWDPTDEDRYDKLRSKSGAAGIPGLTSDSEREFDLLGWLELHTMHLMMQVRAENEQFNLLTGGIRQYNSLLDIKSVAFGPTTDSYVQMWDDIQNTVADDPDAYYTRTVGPYKWQDQGGSKFLNHFAKLFGMTGTSLDPALAIQNFQSFQAKVKR